MTKTDSRAELDLFKTMLCKMKLSTNSVLEKTIFRVYAVIVLLYIVLEEETPGILLYYIFCIMLVLTVWKHIEQSGENTKKGNKNGAQIRK